VVKLGRFFPTISLLAICRPQSCEKGVLMLFCSFLCMIIHPIKQAELAKLEPGSNGETANLRLQNGDAASLDASRASQEVGVCVRVCVHFLLQ